MVLQELLQKCWKQLSGSTASLQKQVHVILPLKFGQDCPRVARNFLGGFFWKNLEVGPSEKWNGS